MKQTVKIIPDSESTIREAASILRQGGLVALPTETVYGLAADAANAQAVKRIYKAKKRPSSNPLISHIANLEMAERYGHFDANATRLANDFWPGPLTVVVPRVDSADLTDAVTAGLPTVALRDPTGPMRLVCDVMNGAIAAPSANISGRLSPTTAEHVAQDLGDAVDLIVDDGPCSVGLESTIVKCVDDKVMLLREGGLSLEMLEASIGPISRAQTNKLEAPGMMLKHYAPGKPLRLNAKQADEGEALLGFGPEGGKADLNLSPSGNPEEAARNLFAMLHELDDGDSTSIAVQPIPDDGLGASINDRLRRAAAGANARD